MPDPVFDAFNQASAAPAAGIGKAQVADPVFDAFNKGAAAPPSGIGGTPKPPSDPVFDAFNQRYAISSLPPDKLEQLSAAADCSLFTQRYYAQKGVALPRTAM